MSVGSLLPAPNLRGGYLLDGSGSAQGKKWAPIKAMKWETIGVHRRERSVLDTGEAGCYDAGDPGFIT
jgi:hypothetical protein